MNFKEVKKLSNEELRMKIAALCGWTCRKKPDARYRPVVMHPPGDNGGYVRECPNYPADLNAMNEAEKMFDDPDGYKLEARYMRMLARTIGYETEEDEDVPAHIYGTPSRQRAEAFVLTMEEK